MRLLETKDLQEALEKRLAKADKVDLAVAWAWSCEALERLRAAAANGARVRAIVGLAGGHTQPLALRALASFGSLRIADGGVARNTSNGIFHPKVFIFRSNSSSFGWVGSANLSDGGFVRNHEAVWEVSPADDLLTWFERLWEALPPDPSTVVDVYSQTWSAPGALTSGGAKTRIGAANPDRLPELSDGWPTTWNEFLEALRVADIYWRTHSPNLANNPWSVLGEAHSWRDTILSVGQLVRRQAWFPLSGSDRSALLGIDNKEGAWGLLGSMRSALMARHLFRGSTDHDCQILQQLREALSPLLTAQGTNASIEAAVTCLSQMTIHNGIAHGVATRLIALARPDVAVSVNGGSAPKLGALTNLPSNPTVLGQAENYRQLLQSIAGQPWYNSQRPNDPWQAALWSMRAALVDCFVYAPI